MGGIVPGDMVQGVHRQVMRADNISHFERMVLSQAERLLSLEDRNVNSRTFGCFDRSYWAWKSKDMQDACMQNGVYAAALLWSRDFAGNIYFNNGQVLEWIAAGIRRWADIQHSDGSFDQIFPHEHSYGATAFTLFYMLETCGIMGGHLSDEIKALVMSSSKKAAEFLTLFAETHGSISNHSCAASAALLDYFQMTGEEKYRSKAKEILSAVFNNRDEGWLTEYGGADPGYQTLGLYYLAKYYMRSGDKEMLEKLNRIVGFLSYFMQPDGSFGGGYGSRNTGIFYPAGFAFLERRIPLAGRMIDFFLDNLFSDGTVRLSSMDEGNIVPLLINYLEALTSIERVPGIGQSDGYLVRLPFERGPFSEHLRKAGFYIVNERGYYAIVGLSKNGLLKVYDKHNKASKYDDPGYMALTRDGRALSSNFMNKKAIVEISGNSLTIKGFLSSVSLLAPTPGKMLFLRALNIALCRFRIVRESIKKALVRVLVMPGNTNVVIMERKIKFLADGIAVEDLFLKPASLRIVKLTRDEKHSTMHTATSDYFRKSELKRFGAPPDIDMEEFNSSSKLKASFYI